MSFETSISHLMKIRGIKNLVGLPFKGSLCSVVFMFMQTPSFNYSAKVFFNWTFTINTFTAEEKSGTSTPCMPKQYTPKLLYTVYVQAALTHTALARFMYSPAVHADTMHRMFVR
jgi:hypothetical protein